MKVTIEGTTEDILDLTELLAIDRDARRTIEVTRNIVRGTIPPRDNVPNRFREEGV